MLVTWVKSRKEATEKAKAEGKGKVKIRKAKTSHDKAKKLANMKISED